MFTCRTMCSVDAVMIYWLSSSIGSSLRIYYETSAVMPGTDRTAAENRARSRVVGCRVLSTVLVSHSQ